jgi:lipopolysaccharide transport system ATP-binding protein
MSEVAIAVEGLGKRYRIGASRAPYRTLRETIIDAAASPVRRVAAVLRGEAASTRSSYIWALKDVSFEVRQGEAVGIIGRNGAGKSTLLKVLSRITKPTEGRAKVSGRVGSLLEVGTGFHPELTGRENIYLNGAILGMRRAEILRKFDEIVAFSEIEEFLDTPVKHYSSGMYVRLAFAVAAHLEPEILVVDEVLAVGDASFQKKCLGKMGDVSRGGRTVLFVSHNMSAVATLCNRCLLIHKGNLSRDGTPSEVTSYYQTELYPLAEDVTDLRNLERYGSGRARFTSLRLQPLDRNGAVQGRLVSGGDLRVELNIVAHTPIRGANVAFTVYDGMGYRLIDVNTALHSELLDLETGHETRVEFTLHELLLKPATYLVGLWLGQGTYSEDIDGLTYVTSLSVEPDVARLQGSVVYPGPYQCRFSHKIHPSRSAGAGDA